MGMGDFEAVAKIMQSDLPAAQRELILGANAARALSM
jgi:hypothetical protein